VIGSLSEQLSGLRVLMKRRQWAGPSAPSRFDVDTALTEPAKTGNVVGGQKI